MYIISTKIPPPIKYQLKKFEQYSFSHVLHHLNKATDEMENRGVLLGAGRYDIDGRDSGHLSTP